jgi:hypothetical protein
VVRFEELLANVKSLDTSEAETYFSALFDHIGIEMPDNWRERVLIGSDPKQSGTASENLNLADIPIPKELPDMQKRLVDVAAPGYRAILGYK